VNGHARIPRDVKWRQLVVDREGGRLPRELHVNGWVLAFEQLAGELMAGWQGPFESRLTPPRRRTRAGWVPLLPADIVLGTSHRLTGHQAHALEPINPHARLELQLPDRSRAGLIVEYDQGEDLYDTEQRLRHYDLFLSGWAHTVERYHPPARAPIAVFVCADENGLASLLELADRALTTQIAKAGTAERDWPFLGRQSIPFAHERDIHERSLQALAVPAYPHKLRAEAESRAPTANARRMQIIDPQLIADQPNSAGHED
jgi:hypothetical protein